MPSEFKIAKPSDLSIKILKLIQNELVDEVSDQPVLVNPDDLGLDLLVVLSRQMLAFRESAMKVTGEDIPLSERLRVALKLQALSLRAIRGGLIEPLQ